MALIAPATHPGRTAAVTSFLYELIAKEISVKAEGNVLTLGFVVGRPPRVRPRG